MALADRVTVGEAAVALGISASAVSQQTRKFGLPRDKKGRFSLEAYKSARIEHLNPAMARGRKQPDPYAGDPLAGDSYAGATASHKRMQTDLLRLKLETEAKRLVDAAAVESRLRGSMIRFRSILLEVPDRMARVHGLSGEARMAMETLIDDALGALARELGALAPVRNSDGD